MCINKNLKWMLVSLIFMCGIFSSLGQELRVKSFKPTNDLLQHHQIRTDVNGVEAAVIKVILPMANASFDGNLIGEPEFYGNEYWVWMEGDAAGSGTAMFDVRCPGARTLRVYFSDYGISLLRSSSVYELKIDIPEHMLNNNMFKDSAGEYLMLTVMPKEKVTVLINGKPKTLCCGQVCEFLPYGTHEYSVSVPGYINKIDTINITRGKRIERSVSLNIDCNAPHTLEVADAYYANKEYDAAVAIYKRLSERGNAIAEYNLGEYYDKINSSQDAIKWYSMSAEHGYAVAQEFLGMLYWLGGMGVEENDEEAVRLWRLAAGQGNEKAIENLKREGYSLY